jgi:hypothetical protein
LKGCTASWHSNNAHGVIRYKRGEIASAIPVIAIEINIRDTGADVDVLHKEVRPGGCV